MDLLVGLVMVGATGGVGLYGNALAVQLGLADTGAFDDVTGLLVTRKDRRKPAAP